MSLLAIDTSGPGAIWTGVGDEGALDPRVEQAGRKHDAVLAKGVAEWLEAHGGAEALEAVAVVTGPGAFTGLRVGVAFATAFAEARDLPVVPVSSYEKLAARAPDGMPVWALAYGGTREIRARLMVGGARPEAAGEIETRTVQDLGMPPSRSEPVLPLGPGYDRHRERIDELLGPLRIEEAVLRPEAEALALAARWAWRAGRTLDALEVDVDYGAEFRPTKKKRG